VRCLGLNVQNPFACSGRRHNGENLGVVTFQITAGLDLVTIQFTTDSDFGSAGRWVNMRRRSLWINWGSRRRPLLR
jgi:hypothetical protein